MPIDAIALVRVPFDALTAPLGEAEEDGALRVFETERGPLAIEPIEGGCLVHLGIGFGAEPEEIGTRARVLLGEALGDVDALYVFPDVTTPSARTPDAIEEELGEGGMRVRVPSAKDAAAALRLGGAETADLFGAMQGLLGGDLLGQVQQALADPGGDGMQSLAKMAQSLLQDEGIRSAVQETAAKLQAGGALDGLEGGAGGGLLEQAKAIAEKVAADDPEMMQELAEKLREEE